MKIEKQHYSDSLHIQTRLSDSLHIPLIPQIADELCWAAITEMVSTYYHQYINTNAPIITQCELFDSCFASPAFGSCNIDCNSFDTSNIPSICNRDATPFPKIPNTQSCFGYSDTYNKDSNGFACPLKWSQLDSFLRKVQMPVIFEWGWEGITIMDTGNMNTHYLVAEGAPHSSYIPSHGWVSINDPWPVGKGRHSIIAYSLYINNIPAPTDSSVHTSVYNSHGVDYIDIQYTGQ